MQAYATLVELATSPMQTLVVVVGSAILIVRTLSWIAGKIASAIVPV